MNLSDMSWDDLMDLRMQAGKNVARQQQIAPYEHRAWARETVGQNPLLALPYAVMIPGYQAAKAIGLLQSNDPNHPTTRPSWEQIRQGFTGVGEGLLNWYNK
jgi:hypothetical protein